MNRNYKETLVISFLLFLVMIIFWQMICYFKLIDVFWLPSPHKFFETAFKLFKLGVIQENIFITLRRFLPGFILGSLLAIVIGSFCGTSRKLSVFLEPLIYLMLPIPRTALLPFLVLIFGTGISSKIIYVAMGAFFPVVINTISGVSQVNKDFLEVAKHYGAKGWRLYRRVILPGSLPAIFIGLRMSIGLSLTYVTVVEFLTTTDGIGAMIWLSLQSLRMDKLFIGVAVIALLNTSFILLLKGFEWLLVPWNEDKQNLAGY